VSLVRIQIRWHEEIVHSRQLRLRSHQRNEQSALAVVEEGRGICLGSTKVSLKKNASPEKKKKIAAFGTTDRVVGPFLFPVWSSSKDNRNAALSSVFTH
jgi:hypothetical protein